MTKVNMMKSVFSDPKNLKIFGYKYLYEGENSLMFEIRPLHTNVSQEYNGILVRVLNRDKGEITRQGFVFGDYHMLNWEENGLKWIEHLNSNEGGWFNRGKSFEKEKMELMIDHIYEYIKLWSSNN